MRRRMGDIPWFYCCVGIVRSSLLRSLGRRRDGRLRGGADSFLQRMSWFLLCWFRVRFCNYIWWRLRSCTNIIVFRSSRWLLPLLHSNTLRKISRLERIFLLPVIIRLHLLLLCRMILKLQHLQLLNLLLKLGLLLLRPINIILVAINLRLIQLGQQIRTRLSLNTAHGTTEMHARLRQLLPFLGRPIQRPDGPVGRSGQKANKRLEYETYAPCGLP
mmetsp:Transcript_4572/g.8182  ORF Transcript_4572/g.8182 Transcript_4572/m.8182 type:complete len:217 (+) Transcript_4572:424-1074(+)